MNTSKGRKFILEFGKWELSLTDFYLSLLDLVWTPLEESTSLLLKKSETRKAPIDGC